MYVKNGLDFVENIVRDEFLIENILKFFIVFWMCVIVFEIFEMWVLRELFFFILLEIDLDFVDVFDVMNIEFFFIFLFMDFGKGGDWKKIDFVRVDNFYIYKEIEVVEVFLFVVIDVNKFLVFIYFFD